MKELDMVEKIRETIRTEIDKRFDAKHYRLIDKDDLAEIKLMVQGGEIELSVMEWDEETCSIGAVTHVFVNDPAKGYGIFIETMLEH